MNSSVSSFEKNIFKLLLYVSGFSGFISDLVMDGNRTPFYFLFDGLIILLLLMSLSYMRGVLGFIILFILLCIVFNLSYNKASLASSLNGIREIIIIPCLVIFYNKIFAEGNEETTEEYIEIFRKYATIFLLAQIPVSFMQFFQYGPSDYVGGTFGNKGSGILTVSVICLVYFQTHFRKSSFQTALLYSCLIPLLLNETKISFILIPMMFIFIYFALRMKSIILAVGAAALFFFLFNTFFTSSLTFGGNLTEIFSTDFLNDYLFGDIDFSDDVPRFTKIVLAWQLLAEQTNTFLFGYEYGLFKGGSVLGLSSFAQTYQWLLSGTRPYLFFLLIQGGVCLLAGIMWLIMHINNSFRSSNKFKNFLLLILLITMFYNDSFRSHNFCAVYLFLVFYANSPLYNTHKEEAA